MISKVHDKVRIENGEGAEKGAEVNIVIIAMINSITPIWSYPV
jgi:hypothetical protein